MPDIANAPRPAFVVAVLGAESTGKTTLAATLAQRLEARGLRVLVVDEALRTFCVEHARTPRRDEQAGVADAQTKQIEAASRTGDVDVVVADTTALMIAVYSDFLFGDRSLYASALDAQRRVDLTLVTANDVPWQADGLQRDGAHVREPVAALLNAALTDGGIASAAIEGLGQARVESAMNAIDAAYSVRTSSRRR